MSGSAPGRTPLFIDTGAFYAYYDPDDDEYERSRAVFEAIRAGELVYGPLYTSRYVLSETATLTLVRQDHATASRALNEIRAAGFQILDVDEALFARTCEQFDRYDDHKISFVDHLTGVLCDEHGIERVFTFDPGDFRTLGFTAVPEDTGEP